MKRGALQKSKYCGGVLLLLSSIASFISPTHASAATIGGAPCVQTVDVNIGVSVFRDGSACYVAFKSAQSYVWSPPTGVSRIDVLIVAGGGGGGARHAGGGGAGGLINLTAQTISSSDISITVGGGGAGGPATSSAGSEGSNGGNSQVSGGGITTRTAIGGGGGGYTLTSGSGGSSGGGGCCGQAIGTATSGQGNIGGAGHVTAGVMYAGGGGGGAGAIGTAATVNSGGRGGDGAVITWISTSAQSSLSVGQNVSSSIYFAGGGGGSTSNNGSKGDGGNGGGGAGANTAAVGTAAIANTGGGGGGSGMNAGGAYKGGDGGSGVVVIRYFIPAFTGSATSSIAENTATTTNAATITVSESSTITIRPGQDGTFFTLIYVDSVTARVRFLESPDYEARADLGSNNEYDLTVRATLSTGNYSDFALKITVTDVVESAVLGTPSLSGTPSKGRALTITITSDTPGALRFFVGDKRIANCLARSTTGSYPNYSATCTWRPAVTGSQRIYATIKPTDGALSSLTSPIATTFVLTRSNTR
jgi:hypothetical protein